MTDYLELLLAALEAQEEPEAILRLPRRRRVTGRNRESEPFEEQTVSETEKARETPEPPEEKSSATARERQTARDALPQETAGVRDALYREMDRARDTLRRRGQPAQYTQGGAARRDGVAAAAVQSTEWNAWETPSGAPGQTRYAALVDAEFQRDARRYDGALGLL